MFYPLTNEKGQGLTEYGLILFFVVIVVIAIVAAIGPQTLAMFTQILNTLMGI